MVTFFELIPEIIPIVCVIGLIIVARCFLDPLAEEPNIINKSEFKSLRKSLYKDNGHDVTFTDN